MSLKIEYLTLDEIFNYDKNARVHSADQIDQIVSSIQEFGFTNPVLIDSKNELIAGHGRLAAAEILGLEKVPAIRLESLTEKQVKALRIADNQLALNASWDLDLLASELISLDDGEFNLDLLGFDEDFLSGLLDENFDDVPPENDDQSEQTVSDEKVAITVGPYEINVKRHEWDKWETSVRAKAGFGKDEVIQEIKNRLGFKK